MKTKNINKEKVTDLIGYVKEYGHNKINAHHPFNNVDAVVVCRISYFPLESFIDDKFYHQVTIKELAIRMLNIADMQKLGTYETKDMNLLRLMMKSERYKDMKVCGFHSMFSLRKAEQFAACTVLINSKVAFVSFRGTDATFNGWKEDFDLGVLGSIPSHTDALKYVKQAMNHFQGKNFMFGGHSKGGNLASYVSLMLPNNLRGDRFIKSYIIDGPGFRKDVLDMGKYDDIQDKVVSLAPVQSIVGMILYSPFPVRAIDSKGVNVFQHDVYVWKIKGTEFVETTFDPISYTTKRWTITLFEDQSIEEIKMTLDALFAFLENMYGDTVSDIFAHPYRSLFLFVGGLRNLDPKAREVMIRSGKLYLSYFKTISESNEYGKKKKIALDKVQKSNSIEVKQLKQANK